MVPIAASGKGARWLDRGAVTLEILNSISILPTFGEMGCFARGYVAAGSGGSVPNFTLYTLQASQITVSGGASLSGITQGTGVHLAGRTITLNTNAWQTLNITDDDNFFADNDTNQVLNGTQTYNGVTHASGRIVEAEYTLTLRAPDGTTYTVIGVNIREAGSSLPVYGTIEGLAFIGPVGGFPPVGVPLTVIGTSEGPGPSVRSYSSHATPPCFTPGTLIETAGGPVAVEEIEVGDLVVTLDSGVQPVRWVGRTDISVFDLVAQPRLRPVLIRAGALGGGLPERDMVVSPMHRVLRGGARAELLFGSDEVLVAAAHLVDGAGVVEAPIGAGVSYIHLAFDSHQIVRSDGVWSESFLPGGQALSGLDRAVQAELETIFPEIARGAVPAAARPCLRRHEAALLRAA
jgi:hypothetical protein